VLKIIVNQSTPSGCAVEIVNENCEVYLLIKGLVDIVGEIGKLEAKLIKVENEHSKLEKLTQGPNYHKVPDKLKSDNVEKLAALKQEVATTEKALSSFRGFL